MSSCKSASSAVFLKCAAVDVYAFKREGIVCLDAGCSRCCSPYRFVLCAAAQCNQTPRRYNLHVGTTCTRVRHDCCDTDSAMKEVIWSYKKGSQWDSFCIAVAKGGDYFAAWLIFK